MSELKTISKKHVPQGIEIIYEDRDIIVINKSAGLLTVGTERDKQNTAHSLMNEYVRRGNSKSKERVYIVHRLDRDTSGLLIFARSEKSKHFLQENWDKFSKKYVAVVCGTLKEKEGIIESYLAENKAFRVYSTNDLSIGKYSKTGYKVLSQNSKYALVDINLFTGRKNQIRVHFSDLSHPVAGDKVYGTISKDIKRLALHSQSITFIHPYSKKEISFSTEIPGEFRKLVK